MRPWNAWDVVADVVATTARARREPCDLVLLAICKAEYARADKTSAEALVDSIEAGFRKRAELRAFQ